MHYKSKHGKFVFLLPLECLQIIRQQTGSKHKTEVNILKVIIMLSHNANLAAHYIAGRTIKPMLPATLLCIKHTNPACISNLYIPHFNKYTVDPFPRSQYFISILINTYIYKVHKALKVLRTFVNLSLKCVPQFGFISTLFLGYYSGVEMIQGTLWNALG